MRSNILRWLFGGGRGRTERPRYAIMTPMPDQIPIRIHHQKRRGMAMKRTPVGLVVFLPKWMRSDSPQAQAFIAEGIHKLGAPRCARKR